MNVINIKVLRLLLSLLLCSFTLISCSENNSSDIQPSNTIKAKQSLAGEWHFKIDPYNNGIEQEWWQVQQDTSNWDTISVPGVWDTYDRYHDYTGTAWYRYQFNAQKVNKAEKILLNFDSVYHDSEVWLNGEKIGENKLGFMSFKFDVSEKLNVKEKNTLVVRVNNRVKRGAVWNWGGIRFPVYLTYQPKTHIEGVYVTSTPNLENGIANINVRTKISENASLSQDAEIQLTISHQGKNVYTKTINTLTQTIDDNNQINISHDFTLDKENVALWHFNHPNLYNIEATLLLDKKEHHKIEDRFGIRKIETKNNALYLNGEKIRLNGLNMVPEDRFDGNALPLSRIKEDVDLLKTLNGNFARLSGPALPEAYLDYLDEVGFLLIEEVGLWGKDKLVDPDHPLPKEWLKRLVNDHYNHPSIIGWSVGNEIGDLKKNPKALEYVEGAIKHAKALDPSRLSVYISFSADYQKNDPTLFSDIVMFNKYEDHEERLKIVHDYHPDKAIFFSEIGTKLDGVDPNESTLDPQTLWNGLKKYPYLIGTSHFAFSDYRSDWKDNKPTWTTDYSENRAWGVLTAYRQPKRSFEKLQNFNAPVEHLALTQTQSNAFELSIEPKSTNTFPAFTLKDYQVIWIAQNEDGEITSADAISLPTIFPGDDTIKRNFNVSGDFTQVTARIIDPFGYTVKRVNFFTKAPNTPTVKSVFSSLDIIRVTFDKSDMATEYQLELTSSDGTKILGKPTINNFAEVHNLEGDQEYSLALKAINTAGESNISSTQLVKTTPDELPPIIWSTAAKNNAFHIGFSVHRKDFKYEIQYGLSSNEYSKTFLIDTHGASQIPAIEKGKDHYFRLRRLVTGSVDSEWTDEYKVIMPKQDGLRAPENAYVFASEKGAILGLTPVQGATNYRVKWVNNGETQMIETNLAYSPFITINNPSVLKAEKITIATIDNYGNEGPYQPVRIINN